MIFDRKPTENGMRSSANLIIKTHKHIDFFFVLLCQPQYLYIPIFPLDLKGKREQGGF